MIILDDINQCTGCTACEEVCPLSCIEMKEDEQGFLFPLITQENCTDCGLCRKICPSNTPVQDKKATPRVYAVKHKSDAIRFESTSGGFFTAISDYIIEQGGVVFGVQFDQRMRVVHAKATAKEKCKAFMGSKYVQSTKGSIFKEVKEELKSGKFVLFTGTPCEVAGLNSFLMKPFENLITCDIICHGVPSSGLWNEYLRYLETKYNSALESFSFRNKSIGWHQPIVRKKMINGKEIITPLGEEAFGYLFNCNMILRLSCEICLYANLSRPSDITMGDFWAIQNVNRAIDDNKGVSQVLINSAKGQALFDNVKHTIIAFEAKLQESLQHNLENPTPRNPASAEFWEDYTSNGFVYILRKYRPRFIRTKKILKSLGVFDFFLQIKRKIQNKKK